MKKLLGIISSFSASLMYPAMAFAQGSGAEDPNQGGSLNLCPEEGSGFRAFCEIGTGDFGPIIATAIIVVFIIAIVIALIWLVIGGIKWITSSGDSSKVEAARNQIIAAVIGLIIVFLSFFILNFVLSLFGLSLTGIEIPVLPGFGEGE